jgi:hypothetical protein
VYALDGHTQNHAVSGIYEKIVYLYRKSVEIMDKEKVDMYYRFTSDEEPTDEQLAVIMEEVGEDVRRESAELKRKLHESLEREYQKAKERYGQ